jgi:quercetin 2,3-dioxygenase
MLTVRKSADRGTTKIGWLDSQHTFSFGDYRDAEHVSFGPLRVINEDRVIAGGGFAPHNHRDMEIVTYVLDGALAHKDSLGSSGIIRPGEIQRMSAGSGITRSEFNASKDAPVHFLQIWILPSKEGVDPSYEQKRIDPETVANRLSRIASPDPRESEVRLQQDAEIWAAKLSANEEVVHQIDAGRRAWVQVARGVVTAGPHRLTAGDALAITDESAIAVRAHEPSEILLFDMA